jgi:hypothetical protein
MYNDGGVLAYTLYPIPYTLYPIPYTLYPSIFYFERVFRDIFRHQKKIPPWEDRRIAGEISFSASARPGLYVGVEGSQGWKIHQHRKFGTCLLQKWKL